MGPVSWARLVGPAREPRAMSTPFSIRLKRERQTERVRERARQRERDGEGEGEGGMERERERERETEREVDSERGKKVTQVHRMCSSGRNHGKERVLVRVWAHVSFIMCWCVCGLMYHVSSFASWACTRLYYSM